MANQNIMSVTPVTKKRLHEEITEQFKNKIISGELKAGEKLPSERKLAEVLGVNRSTLREAINKLESMELVEIRHGDGVYIKDYLESGSLELVGKFLFIDGELNIKVLKNLIELRRLLVPEISFHAALNRSKEDLKDLERIVFHSDDISIQERDWRVHNIIARASGNIIFVIILNSFTNLANDTFSLYFNVEENRKYSAVFHSEIYKAIERKDAAAAKKIMLDTMIYAEKQTYSIIADLENKSK